MNWKRNNCRSQETRVRSQESLLFCLAMLCCQLSFASAADDFKAANQLYDAATFSESIVAYEKIEPKTAHVFFNLGNACFRANQIGKAILNYERARRLAPRDPDILANLKFAQERVGVDASNTPPGALRRFRDSILYSRTLNEWSGYELCALWVTVAAIAGCIWLPRARTAFIVVSIAAFLWLGAVSSALSYRIMEERYDPKGVVLVRIAEARFAPLADATVHFKLAEGTQVTVKEDRGQWLYVERADGQQGWVASDTVEQVSQF